MSIINTTDPDLAGLLTRKQPIVIPSAPKCPKCNKSVYKAEETRAANQIFHKLCFKCGLCSRLLETNILTEHQGELFCKSCYAKNFGPKGYGYGSGAGTLSMDGPNLTSLNTNGHSNGHTNGRTSDENTADSNYLSTVSSLTSSTSSTTSSASASASASLPFRTDRKTSLSTNTIILGNTEKCGRCQKAVYMAEKVAAAGHSYHKLCFTCFTCKKLLSSMNCCDNSDGEIFCKGCYGKQYGPKGIGYGIGAGTLKTN